MKRILLLPLLLLASNLAHGLSLYEAIMDGPSEAPPNASPGVGYALLAYDPGAHTLQIDVAFSGLLGTTTAAHIHGPTALPDAGTAGVITTTPYFVGFPIGVTSGVYSHLLDLTLASSYRAGFLSSPPIGGSTALAELALIDAMEDGTAYFNIHTTAFPGGEIRGFTHAVPEPGTWMAMISFGALAGTVLVRRFRRCA